MEKQIGKCKVKWKLGLIKGFPGIVANIVVLGSWYKYG